MVDRRRFPVYLAFLKPKAQEIRFTRNDQERSYQDNTLKSILDSQPELIRALCFPIVHSTVPAFEFSRSYRDTSSNVAQNSLSQGSDRLTLEHLRRAPWTRGSTFRTNESRYEPRANALWLCPASCPPCTTNVYKFSRLFPLCSPLRRSQA